MKTLKTSILLKRIPILNKSLSDLEYNYLDLKSQISQLESKPFISDFYFKKGTTSHQKFQQLQQSLPDIHQTAQVIDPLPSTVLPRTQSPTIDSDFKSLDRQMTSSLYLITQNTNSTTWNFPTSNELSESEYLHESADNTISTLLGPIDFWRVGNAPVGFIDSHPQEKIYFMKCHILAGNISPHSSIQNHAWCTKTELKEYLDPEYYNFIKDMLN